MIIICGFATGNDFVDPLKKKKKNTNINYYRFENFLKWTIRTASIKSPVGNSEAVWQYALGVNRDYNGDIPILNLSEGGYAVIAGCEL